MGGRGWVGGNGWKKILYEYIVQCCMGPKVQMFFFLNLFALEKATPEKMAMFGYACCDFTR